ncbi:hypothetical protein DPEC_G00030320 [Dallia pectoralis]|uniref:Uncharacterized protein n=1 Tax=Dallia pectoralis TaxID=75939 RepID=A0ACC2HC29_DALPE|nr:hypothetical protein DPEC_G00030320 [Dallia pectoralis]
MRVAVLLVLLFCLTGPQKAHGESEDEAPEEAPETTQSDPVWNELSQLREMIMEQNVKLKNVENRLRDNEDIVDDMDIDLVLTIRTVELLEKDHAALSLEMKKMVVRLNVSEGELKELRKNTTFQSRLTASMEEVEEPERKNTTFEYGLTTNVGKVEKPKRTNKGRTKVASAGFPNPEHSSSVTDTATVK